MHTVYLPPIYIKCYIAFHLETTYTVSCEGNLSLNNNNNLFSRSNTPSSINEEAPSSGKSRHYII